MKISEMTTEQAFDVMQKLAPYVSEIVTDNAVGDVAAEYRETKNAAAIMDNLFPLMLVNHREALYNIVAVSTGKTVETVKKQPLADTKADLDASVCDDMFDFFILFLRMAVRA